MVWRCVLSFPSISITGMLFDFFWLYVFAFIIFHVVLGLLVELVSLVLQYNFLASVMTFVSNLQYSLQCFFKLGSLLSLHNRYSFLLLLHEVFIPVVNQFLLSCFNCVLFRGKLALNVLRNVSKKLLKMVFVSLSLLLNTFPHAS